MTEPRDAWETLQRESMHCPMLYRAVTIAERDGNREAAMVAALIWFSRHYRKHIASEVERIMHVAPDNFPAVPSWTERED